MSGFTHLHVHSEYSLLDGLARVGDLVRVAGERGFDALALTDHGVMFGAVQFYQHCVKAGIKPILGCELYVAARGRRDRDPALDRRSHHLTVLARDERGYHNLLRLVSQAQLEGFYYRPRVDHELLARHHEGLIVLSGCPSGEVPRLVLAEQLDAARSTLGWYKEVFGDRLYVELQNHELEFIPRLNRGLVELARALDLPLVATNDVHYARPEDVGPHEVLLCLQTGTTMADPKRLRYGPTFYLRSEAEMRALFAELPAAVSNSARIAEACEVALTFGRYNIPRFDVPAGETAATFLRRLCQQGVRERYPAVTTEVEARLAHELDIICQMGFEDYFLIVWDLCRHAREQGIWWNVRGSGAGSIVAYSLHVTNIDPLAHGLIFERFLNPARISMPDIDLDFPDDQRDDLIRYAYDRYGHDRVAQIITFGTMGARAAIRDAGRALDLPLAHVDRVARLVPAIPGKPCGIDDVLRETGREDEERSDFYSAELAGLYRDDDEVRLLLDTARRLEGVARHASTHAAGVVISDGPLVEHVPLHRPTRGADASTDAVPPLTQFNMKDVESLGLLKVDFLGLATLTVLRRAADLIERHHGVRYTLDTIPLDDPAIYDLLAGGNVAGVFQVEGAGMRRMLREMRPRRFEDVVAAVALYRPGPMDYIPSYIARLHGREAVSYRHPALEPVLGETYGICVYQEQIIRLARDLAGYDAGEADTIRKAVGKKNKDQLLRHRSKFVAGAVGNGLPRATAEALFDDIETFARYGFNKAHAADYAVIVCQTAYFKAHYPVEYLTALLSVDRQDTDRIALLAADAHHNGIQLLRPDLNQSALDFAIEPLDPARPTPEGVQHRRGIRFGLAAIKNVGEGPVQALLAARADGPFTDLEDLCRRADLRAVGKRVLESLVKAGALDDFGPRGALLAVIDRMVAYSSSQRQAAEAGQLSLFGDALPLDEVPLLHPLPQVEAAAKDVSGWEKDLLGVYLSEHPLHRVAEGLAEAVTTMIGGIDASMAGQPVTLAGMVVAVRRTVTKKGEPMAFARIEDLQGSIEVTLFPRAFAASRDLWQEDNLVVVEGRVEVRGDRLQVIAASASAYDPRPAAERGAGEDEPDAPAEAAASYRLYVHLSRGADPGADIERLAEVYRTLTRYRGGDRFNLFVPNGPDTVELEFPNSTTRYCVGLVRALESLLGEGCVEVRATTGGG